MANNLFVSYDLFEPGKNYEKVIAAVKQLGNWARVHLSVWYVKSSYTATQASEHIWNAMDRNDKVLVVDATNSNAAWQNLDPNIAQFVRENWNK